MSLVNIMDSGASYSVGVALNYLHLATTGTVVISTVPKGLFHICTVNTAGTTGATATFFDATSASGGTISVIDISSKGTFGYNANYANGLTVVVAGSAVGDLTVGYL